MSTIELAIPTVLRHEGGLVDNPNDPGGLTNFGVSLRWLRSKGLADDLDHTGEPTGEEIQFLKGMTAAEATAIYKKYWWDPNNYGNILAQAVATKIFDTSVNMGPGRANDFAQQIVGIEPNTGNFGPRTTQLVNAMPSLQFIGAYQNKMAAFYRAIVEANPARQQFLAGWLNRAYDRI